MVGIRSKLWPRYAYPRMERDSKVQELVNQLNLGARVDAMAQQGEEMRDKLSAATEAVIATVNPSDEALFDPSRHSDGSVMLGLSSCDSHVVLRSLKQVCALMVTGGDVSVFWSDVVKTLASPHQDVKRFSHCYLVAHVGRHPDIAFLALNLLQKDLSAASYLSRAQAMKTLTSLALRTPEIDTADMIDRLGRRVTDSHPYVRKMSAECLTALIDRVDSEERRKLAPPLVQLLRDAEPLVVTAAISALSVLAEQEPSVVSGLHGSVRSLTRHVTRLPAVAQVAYCNLVTKYCLLCFSPQTIEESEDGKDVLTLLQSLSESTEHVVVFAATVAVFVLSPPRLEVCVPRAVRCLTTLPVCDHTGTYDRQMMRFATMMLTHMARVYPALVRPFVRDFLPRGSDNLQLVEAKLALLEATCDHSTLPLVLHCISTFMSLPVDLPYKRAALATLKALAQSGLERSVVYEVYVDILYRYDFEFYPAELLDGLSIMLHEAPRESVTKVIEVIVSAFFATKTPDPASRAAYVTLVCSNLQSLHVDAPDIFRLLCASFDVESDVVQREILVLGFSLWAFYFQVYHKKLSLDNLTGQFPWLADEEVVYRVLSRMEPCLQFIVDISLKQSMNKFIPRLAIMIASTMTQAAQDPDGMLSEALNKCTAFQPQRLYKENGSAGPEAYIFTASSAPRWTNRFPKDSVRNANSDVAPVEKAISPVVRPPTLGGITRYHDIPDFAFRGSLDEFLGTASPTRKGAVLDGEASDSELESPVECENDLMPDDIRPIRIDV